MVGYVRNDTSNNIADTKVIDASDLDGEYDAIVDAFHNSTGHVHDGSSANGSPIEVFGPAQEYLGDGTSFNPKTDDTYDLGTAALEWKDLHLDGTANIDTALITAGTVTTLTTDLSTVVSSGDLAVADGGTGSSTAGAARTALGVVPGTDVQAFDDTLLSIAALGTASDRMAYTTGVDTWAEATLTSTGRDLIDDASTGAQRTTMGVAIGSDVQAWDTQLDDIAALGVTDGNFIVGDGANWVAETPSVVRTSLSLGANVLAKTATYTAVAGDRSKLISFDVSSGVDLDLTAAATLGDGWWVDVRAVDGQITIVSNGSELINGSTANAAIFTGGSIRISCDGTGFHTTAKTSFWRANAIIFPSATASFTRTGLLASRVVRVSGRLVPVSDDVSLLLRTSTDTSSHTYDAAGGDYRWNSGKTVGTTASGAGSASDTAITIIENIGNAAGQMCSFSFDMRDFGENTNLFCAWYCFRIA